MANVKRRSYDSTGRQERARASQQEMLDAAVELLVERGYADTTLALVAERAGVAAPTVYKAFGNKPAMVKAAFDYAAAGDTDPTPIPERERAQRITAEPDPRQKLKIYTDGMIGRLTRAAPLYLVARAAAEIDAEMRDVWEHLSNQRHVGMGVIAASLSAGGHLRPGVNRRGATDILWAYTSPELYQLMVLIRGWSRTRYRDWVHRSLVDALLPRDQLATHRTGVRQESRLTAHRQPTDRHT